MVVQVISWTAVFLLIGQINNSNIMDALVSCDQAEKQKKAVWPHETMGAFRPEPNMPA